ncbi:MAG: arylsulfatase A-like enzyme, partial [Planctomycetota bacterium]
PNVLLYVADTLRADGLGCYGNAVVKTPHLDAFASEAMVFERAFAPSSWTRASMASILTGTAPGVHGAEGRFDLLLDSALMMSEIFKAAGYDVGSITTNRNVGSFFGFDQGFGAGDFIELYEPSSAERVTVSELTTLADDVTRHATEWMSTATEPFCLIVHSIDPHSPYMPPSEWDLYGAGIESAVDGSQQSLYKLNKTRTAADEARVVSLYYGEIAFNDHAFGTLLDWMRAKDLLDQTVVAFTSDHGEEFWERGERGHGKTLNEKALHVPLILRYPARLARGSRVGRIAGTLDLLPTLLDLARFPVHETMDGKSLLLPASNRENVILSSCKLSELNLSSARNERWKLVFDAATGKRQLFDLEGVEVESKNVIGKHRDIASELYQELAKSFERDSKRRKEIYGADSSNTLGELPPEIEQALEDMGYVGNDSETIDGESSDE